jgi:hypothetical protein
MGKKKSAASDTDPQEVFRLADSFLESSRTLVNHYMGGRGDAVKRSGATMTIRLKRQDWAPLMPPVVLHAFSLELFLKCLILLDSGNIPQSHNSLQLFNALGAVNQARLVKNYKDHLKTDPTIAAAIKAGKQSDYEIANVLTVTGDAFVRFRYIFELPAKPSPAGEKFGGASTFVIRATRDLIIQLQPSWSK